MKNISLLIMLSLMLVLASCDKQGAGNAPTGEGITFNLSTDYDVELTKSGGLSRYIAEIYQGDDLTVAPIYRQEQSSGTFTVPLDASAAYVCLFWVDKGIVDDNINGTFDADSLRDVTLNEGKEMVEAFFARFDMPAFSDDSHSITLKRAMARVNLIATDDIAANTDLVTVHNAYSKFNVSNSKVAGQAASLTQTFNLTATTDTIVSFLTFASASTDTTDISITLGGTVANTVLDAPLKANYTTNIKGKFSFRDHKFILNIYEGWDGSFELPLVPDETTGYYKTDDYEGQGVLIDGLWWAPVNVGYTAANPYGLLYYQSNTNPSDGGVPQVHEYKQADVISSYDPNFRWTLPFQGPCPDGWRVPTENEYANLLTPENSPVGTDDNPGQWQDERSENPNGLAGRWFGPDNATATVLAPGESIFLPAAGFWATSYSAFQFKDSRGRAWTSTLGRAISFADDNSNTGNGNEWNSHYYGFSVRCVKN